MKKKINQTIPLVIIISVILFAVFVPYGKVEYLTVMHRDEFLQTYMQIGMFDEIEYLKVMKYSEDEAQIYYVLENKATGVLATFTRTSTTWVLSNWKTIWSKSGNADGLIWPYYH